MRHLQIVACAGSGKTQMLAQRMAGLLGDGAEPASIKPLNPLFETIVLTPDLEDSLRVVAAGFVAVIA